MGELERAMKEELDLLTSKSSCVEMWSDPVLDSPMYSKLHCEMYAFMYLFTSVSPNSLHVLSYILMHYTYLSMYSLHVLVCSQPYQ